MRIGLIQSEVHAQPERNFKHVHQQVIAHASAHDLLCLPEVFHTPFSGLPANILESQSGPITKLAHLSGLFPGTLLMGSMALRQSGDAANTFMLFHRGRSFPLYEKLHLFKPMDEPRFFSGGNRLSVITLRLPAREWRIGVAICYDLRFPELFRILASVGCEVIVVAAQWPAIRVQAWQTLLEARAIENQVFVAGVNRAGRGDTETFGGHSRIVGPGGEILAAAGDQPTLLSAELDGEMIRKSRDFNHAAADCRSDLYRLDWTGMIEDVMLP